MLCTGDDCDISTAVCPADFTNRHHVQLQQQLRPVHQLWTLGTIKAIVTFLAVVHAVTCQLGILIMAIAMSQTLASTVADQERALLQWVMVCKFNLQLAGLVYGAGRHSLKAACTR